MQLIGRILAVASPVIVAALRAKREAAPRFEVTIGPARVIRSVPEYEVEIGPARISTSHPRVQSGREAGGGIRIPAPMAVKFSLRVSGLEKLGVGQADVKRVVLDNAAVLPGVGKPTVTVTDVSGGYRVSARYPDSTSAISASAAKRRIEGIDSRLRGRVDNVAVQRG